jgi:hypothetical protein
MTPRMKKVLGSPDCSKWLAQALLTALDRDPVDAVNDAEILANLLKEYIDQILAHERG